MERLDFLARLLRIASVFTLVLIAVHSGASENTDAIKQPYDSQLALIYDGRVGPIKVGVLEAHLAIKDQSYELDGLIAGAGPIARLLDWKGKFEAEGVFEEANPKTTSYTLTEEDEKGDELEIKTVHISGSTVVITETGHPRIEREKPRGIDMMSAIFANTQCREEMLVHDGEDPFVIKLAEQKSDVKIRQGKRFYSGSADMCSYKFIYDEDEIRKVDIWLADVQGRRVPVRLRFRIPVLPDGIFRLRMEPIEKLEAS